MKSGERRRFLGWRLECFANKCQERVIPPKGFFQAFLRADHKRPAFAREGIFNASMQFSV